MPRTVITKSSVLGGELGPLAEGRSDLAQFQLGARKLQNFIELKSGATTRRPGTRYVKTAENASSVRLIPFVFSYDDPNNMYVVEISKASSTTLQFVVIRVQDNSHIGVTNAPLTADSTLMNLDEIQYVQSADSLFLVHSSFPPQVLSRLTSVAGSGVDAFGLGAFIDAPSASRATQNSLPYLDENVSTTTLAVNTHTVGTGRTITFSANTLTGTSADVGKHFGQLSGAVLGSCTVTAAISKTQATVSVTVAWNADADAQTTWWEGAWSPDRGWPRTVCFYSQRLVFGGCKANPDTFWMSKVGNYLQMANVNAAFAINDPLKFTLSSQKVNQIRWMVGGKNHTIGTSGSEWVGTVTNDGTNLFVQYDEETTHGSAPVQPFRTAYTIPFVQRSGQTIREMAYEFYSATYPSTDLTMIASHIGAPSSTYPNQTYDTYIKAIDFQESPLSIVWALDSVGRLWGLTRDKQQQIASWHSHVIGGTLAGKPAAKVLSICSVPSPNGRKDRLWMAVQRTINGSTVTHVEYMDDIKDNTDLNPGFFLTNNEDVVDIRSFLDCSVYQETGQTDTDGHNQTVWSGFLNNYLASDNAYVVAYRPTVGVVFAGVLPMAADGSITLPTKATSVVIGLNVNAEFRLLPIEGGENPKINLRSISRIDLCTMKLYQSFGLRIGKDRILGQNGYSENASFEVIPFTNQGPNQKTFSGYKEVQVPHSAENDASYAVVMQEPWPCTILSLSSRVVTNEI